MYRNHRFPGSVPPFMYRAPPDLLVPRYSKMAIASTILGAFSVFLGLIAIVTFLLMWSIILLVVVYFIAAFVGLILGILALVFAIMATVKIGRKREIRKGYRFSITGKVLGGTGILANGLTLMIVVFILILIFLFLASFLRGG